MIDPKAPVPVRHIVEKPSVIPFGKIAGASFDLGSNQASSRDCAILDLDVNIYTEIRYLLITEYVPRLKHCLLHDVHATAVCLFCV